MGVRGLDTLSGRDPSVNVVGFLLDVITFLSMSGQGEGSRGRLGRKGVRPLCGERSKCQLSIS
jgi:hypothetical protein